MSIFDHAEDVLVQGSNFYSIQTQNNHHYNPIQHLDHCESAFDTLSQHANTSTIHDSDERSESPRCYPGTRIAVLEEIERRILEAENSVKSRCIWLSGPAGGGKTAIAQTLAERCHGRGLLVLSSFLLRSLPAPEQLNAVIPTLAYWLCNLKHPVSPYILQAIDAKASIFGKDTKSQMEKLIIRPFIQACEADPSLRSENTIIIVDGLDVCGSEKKQQVLLSLLIEALAQNDIPLVLFVTSRPANHIVNVFDKHPDSFTQIVLDDRFSPSKDIKHFLKSSFQDLKYDPKGSWPSEEVLNVLVERSSGQFLYASDVVDYIRSALPPGAERVPLSTVKERLQDVIAFKKGQSVDFRLRRVDSVFNQLLGSIASRALDTVMVILALMAIYGGYLPTTKRATHPECIQLPPCGITIPWLAKMLALSPAAVLDLCGALPSLFNIPEDPYSQQPLRVYHESIFEFLAAKSRAGEAFFMEAHERIVLFICRWFHSLLKTSIASTTEEVQDENIELMEAVFRFHLPHAHPSKELADSVARLIGFQKLQFAPKRNLVSGRNILICDTKHVIVSFLHTFYGNQKGLTVRWFIARKRLTIFRFFNIKRSCGKTHCSCATRM